MNGCKICGKPLTNSSVYCSECGGIRMKVGMELDALIAENVMGWTSRKTFDDEEVGQVVYDENKDAYVKFSPSTNIADAWLVVEKFADKRKKIDIWRSNMANTWVCHIDTACEESETAPLAICLAALKACRVEVEG